MNRDLLMAALVATDGTTAWFCCPRFESPSVFASLFDHECGGHFQIALERVDDVARQLYSWLGRTDHKVLDGMAGDSAAFRPAG